MLGDGNCGKTNNSHTEKLCQEAVSKKAAKIKKKKRHFKNKSLCVLLLKLSALNVCGKSIEVGNQKKKVDLRMNALLEPKLLHPRKTKNCLQPSHITSQESPLDSIYVFVVVCHEMKFKS